MEFSTWSAPTGPGLSLWVKILYKQRIKSDRKWYSTGRNISLLPALLCIPPTSDVGFPTTPRHLPIPLQSGHVRIPPPNHYLGSTSTLFSSRKWNTIHTIDKSEKWCTNIQSVMSMVASLGIQADNAIHKLLVWSNGYAITCDLCLRWTHFTFISDSLQII
jgi:hypothetical protein